MATPGIGFPFSNLVDFGVCKGPRGQSQRGVPLLRRENARVSRPRRCKPLGYPAVSGTNVKEEVDWSAGGVIYNNLYFLKIE